MDGPIEWCWPVPDKQAARFPDLELRTEAAHQQAYVQVETPHVSNARTMAITEALPAWAGRPAGPIRKVLTPDPPSDGDRPGCDWAIPLRRDS